jgi:AcrR family transcriptional regulator
MDRTRGGVKRARAYDASGRRARARQQHEVTLDAAQSRFVDRGYTATTVESIAERAGVSAATIYKSYGGKAGLVRALCQRALAGEGPVPAEQRSDALRAITDPRQLIAGWGSLVAEVAPRVAPVLLLLRAAAQADTDAADLLAELERDRLTRMGDNARHLARAGHLRSDVTERQARDVLWTCASPELYELLVIKRRWRVTTYSQFIADSMIAALL